MTLVVLAVEVRRCKTCGVGDDPSKSALAEVREELERIGINPDTPVKGLRVRKSNYAAS